MVENELKIYIADKNIKFGRDVRFGILIRKNLVPHENPPMIHDDAFFLLPHY